MVGILQFCGQSKQPVWEDLGPWHLHGRVGISQFCGQSKQPVWEDLGPWHLHGLLPGTKLQTLRFQHLPHKPQSKGFTWWGYYNSADNQNSLCGRIWALGIFTDCFLAQSCKLSGFSTCPTSHKVKDLHGGDITILRTIKTACVGGFRPLASSGTASWHKAANCQVSALAPQATK